jgi:hypothetical protein
VLIITRTNSRTMTWADHDLPRLLQRRGMLKLVLGASLAGTGVVSLAACADDTTGTAAAPTGPEGAPTGVGGSPDGGSPRGGAAGTQQTSDTANGELPEETAGPYPGDGSNGENVLTESGIVRCDITSSFGSSTTTSSGWNVPCDHSAAYRPRRKWW